MPKIKILPIAISIATALIFFALGRILVAQLGSAGVWIIVFVLVVFYALWWANYQRNKRK